MCPAVCRSALAVRAVKSRPHQHRRGVALQLHGHVLPGRQPPAVRHCAAHRGRGGGDGLRAVGAFLHGLAQIRHGVFCNARPLLAGDLAPIKHRLGLGVTLHPRRNAACLGAAVVVGHRSPAVCQGGLHALGHRGGKRHGFRPDKGAAVIGSARQRACADGAVGDLRRQTLRHRPLHLRAGVFGDGSRRRAENVAQCVGKGRGRPRQADAHRLPHCRRPHDGFGSTGNGSQLKTLRRRRGRQIAAVLPHLPAECGHREGLAAVCVVAHLQRAGGESVLLIVSDVGIRSAGVHRHSADGNGGHFHGVGIELMSRRHAAGPVDGGLVGRNILPAALPFHPEV